MLDLVKTVRDIGENSSQIGKIIKTIEAIVFQTNILALNAAVENGTRIADETAQALLQAVAGAKEATRIIDQISEASEHQASAINQVTIGIEQISSVVQSNSATSEQSAAASEELSSQAQVLKRLVSTVRLRDSRNIAASGSYGGSVMEEEPDMDYSKY